MGFNLGDIVSFATDPFGAGGTFTNALGDSPIGSVLGIKQNQMAAEQFKEQMNWEKFKMNNAHQAEVADLKAAGLNPVLSATNGGTGATAGSLTPTANASNGNIGSLLSLLSTIFPAIAGMKQANAAQTIANAQKDKTTAEIGKINAEKDIADLEYLLKYKDWNYYDTKFKYDKSKTPLWIIEQLRNLFKTGANTHTAKNMENFGKEIFNFENSKLGKTLNIINYANPGKQTELLLKFLWNIAAKE